MLKTDCRLERSEILKLYTSGCKCPEDFKISVEYERLPICDLSMRQVDYYADCGIKNLLVNFANCDSWDYIFDRESIIGLKKAHDTITLEPGCQLEISAKPENTIFDLKHKIEAINKSLLPLCKTLGISLLNYGVQPLSTYKSINIIPKNRYKIMAAYLWGILSDVMMRETAGIQCSVDYASQEDAMRKFKLANKLAPFMTAMFANSPVRGGVDTGYKSFRALSWLNTDNDRCGFAGKISEEFSFEDYVDWVLNVPMIFLHRGDRDISVNGDISFNEFMQDGLEGEVASLEDYRLQANLCFPEVRLRNFIEIRNHDCVGGNLKYAVPAIYKGIMYSDDAMSEVEELLKHLQYKDFSQLRYNVPKDALNASVKNCTVADYAKEILAIAYRSLKNMGSGEELFIDDIYELTEQNLTPADIILKNWYGIWDKDVEKLVNYLKLHE